MEFLIMNANGSIEKLECEELTPQITQRVLGGFFETFWIDDNQGILALANEDGIQLGLPINPFFVFRHVLGNVIIAKKDGVELVGLTPDEVELAIKMIPMVH